MGSGLALAPCASGDIGVKVESHLDVTLCDRAYWNRAVRLPHEPTAASEVAIAGRILGCGGTVGPDRVQPRRERRHALVIAVWLP